MKEDLDEKFCNVSNNVYGLGAMVKVSEETFVAEGSSMKSTKLFHLESFYIYGTYDTHG